MDQHIYVGIASPPTPGQIQHEAAAEDETSAQMPEIYYC